MARVARKRLEAVQECVAQLPDDMRGKCGLCNVALLTTVKDISHKTGAPASTVTRVLSEAIGAPKGAMRDRFRNTFEGRRPSSSEKKPGAIVAQVRQDEKPIVAQCHNTEGEKQFAGHPGAKIVMNEIEAVIAESTENVKACFCINFDSANQVCQTCHDALPCKYGTECANKPVEEMLSQETYQIDLDVILENCADLDVEDMISQAVNAGSPVPPMSEMEIIQDLPRPEKWRNLLEKIKDALAPGGTLRAEGLSPVAAAFDLAALGVDLNPSAARVALAETESEK